MLMDRCPEVEWTALLVTSPSLLDISKRKQGSVTFWVYFCHESLILMSSSLPVLAISSCGQNTGDISLPSLVSLLRFSIVSVQGVVSGPGGGDRVGGCPPY